MEKQRDPGAKKIQKERVNAGKKGVVFRFNADI